MPRPDVRLYEFYKDFLNKPAHPITGHLETIRSLAENCGVACEFGVQHGASSSALLLGADEVYSYDIHETPMARHLKEIAGSRWHYHIANSLEVEIPMCELLLIDSLHTYKQCLSELALHADMVTKRLVFHDTLTFGSIGADGESGRQSWTYQRGLSVPMEHLGIRPAIDALMMRDHTWRIENHYVHSHGLLVLKRVGL